MSSRKVTSQSESSTVIVRKANLEDVQQVLDEVRASITKYRFTPEQVFGYRGKADAANVSPGPDASSANASTPKKAAPRKSPGPSRTPGGKSTKPKRVVRGAPEATPDVSASQQPEAAVKTALNPANAWPFPTGSRS
ncbi:hypothetical protein QZM18_25925 [Burkholderia diffusa]|uniref:hypothetical protein n=1 Tax=Burkholderia diffusa TaxID=488732 RepID=UPI002650E0AF|nr:hypothetical protein [Burkholderia diffusa]MDN7907532.1 hypothetical protein [Burkholderia diffusa]